MDRRTSANRGFDGSRWVAEVYDELADEVRTNGRPVVRFEPPRLVVAAPDRRGLLAAVVGTIALHGLGVHRADVTCRGGVAVDTFVVAGDGGRWPETDRVRDDLEAVLAGRLDLAERVASAPGPAPGASAGRMVPPVVDIDNWTSESCTAIEVHTRDQPGLLYGLTTALFDCGLDVVSARVTTYGDAAVDAFHVCGVGGGKVTDPGFLERIQQALHAVVD